ncbi:MAG TPA: signal peptide peptidase SppA [Bacteroidota bacterium]|nr:signal peptide peptidase SppA [Bacteroidota bacterium]
MKKFIIPFLIICATLPAFAQHRFLTYYETARYMQSSPGAFKFGLYGFNNPAILNYLHDADFQVSFGTKEMYSKTPWALNAGLKSRGGPASSFGIIYTPYQTGAVYDYRYAISMGNRELGFGLSYGFVGGDKGKLNRSNTISWGALYRPNAYLSIGAFQTYTDDFNQFESVAEIAIRPIKNYPLTFFGDASMFNKDQINEAQWSAGINWEFMKGIRIAPRYYSNKAISVGLDVSFGTSGISTVAMTDNNQKYDYNTVTLRFGAKDRTILEDLKPLNVYYVLDLSKPIKYQKGIFFDTSYTLLQILNSIDQAKNKNAVKGIVINATSMPIGREFLWEIRGALEQFKATGKKVYMFIDRAGMDDYTFASVADKIIVDPIGGSVSFDGYIIGRSYYKNMLDKIHIGIDEFRYLKYKSAVESFTRENMSEGDREQNQAMIEDWFSTTSSALVSSGRVSNHKLDSLMNSNFIYSTKDLLANHLADTVGRWNDFASIIQKYDNKAIFEKLINESKKPIPYDDKWGQGKEVGQIAVIYAIGECSMTTGIKAVSLVKDIESAMKDPSISAVVVRVDSPGGDAMASDYIADVMKKNRGKKPIIVSQGAVAGSGGYWLSMYGDKIVASPYTITGSIGVIGNWIYDKGLKDTLGISTDFVKIGKFADLGFPFQMPLIGIGLPIRDLNNEEKELMKTMILDMYGEFKDKVAEGRNLNVDSVEKIAQGRIWSGSRGKSIGLVDELGSLQDAINIAKEKVGIKPNEKYYIVEYPKLKPFEFLSLFNQFLFKTPSIKIENPVEDFLKLRITNNGKPMPVMTIDYYDYVNFE